VAGGWGPLGLLLVAGLQPACGGAVRDEAGESGVPATCGAVLRQREGGEPRCDSTPAECARAGQDSTQEYSFVFSFWSPNEDTDTLSCFVDFLRGRGATADIVDWNDVPGITPGTYVTASGTSGMIAPALELAPVAAYSVTCPRCTHCTELLFDDCPQEPFCTVVRGSRLTAEGCMATSPVACRPRIDVSQDTTGCFVPATTPMSSGAPFPAGAMVSAVDARGLCWWTPCASVPEGWAPLSNGTFCTGTDRGTPFCGP